MLRQQIADQVRSDIIDTFHDDLWKPIYRYVDNKVWNETNKMRSEVYKSRYQLWDMIYRQIKLQLRELTND